MTDLRQQLTRSVAEECGAARIVKQPPADRQMLMGTLVGRIKGICKGFSMPDDANQAMLHICDALIAYDTNRVRSFEAEDGPFSATFAVYAEEARGNVSEIEKAKERWEIANVPALLQSVLYLLDRATQQTRGQQRERLYAAARHTLAVIDGARR